jgi:hypothetical protein
LGALRLYYADRVTAAWRRLAGGIGRYEGSGACGEKRWRPAKAIEQISGITFIAFALLHHCTHAHFFFCRPSWQPQVLLRHACMLFGGFGGRRSSAEQAAAASSVCILYAAGGGKYRQRTAHSVFMRKTMTRERRRRRRRRKTGRRRAANCYSTSLAESSRCLYGALAA